MFCYAVMVARTKENLSGVYNQAAVYPYNMGNSNDRRRAFTKAVQKARKQATRYNVYIEHFTTNSEVGTIVWQNRYSENLF